MLLLVSSLLLINACTTPVKDYSKLNEGQWETKTLIKDKKNSRSYVVIMNIYAVRDSALRIDLLSPIGDHMGTLIINKGSLTLVNVGDRTVYRGKAKTGALSSLISLPVNPMHFQNVVFEEPIKGKNWKCEVKGAMVSSCINSSTKLNIEWKNLTDGSRKATLSHKTGSMQINFKKFKKKIEDDINFSLKIPKSYRKVKL